MINRLKNTLFPLDKSKIYYLSGAPQCVLPDVHFTSVLTKAWFDFIWVQFYNTPQCSARAGINNQNGSNKNQDISYTNWTMSSSLNTNVKYYIGLPASTAAAPNDQSSYLTLAEGQQTMKRFYGNNLFGGVMLFEATYARNNTVCGKDQLSWYKDILNGQASGKPATVTCTSSAITSTTSTRSSTTTTRATTTTASVSSPRICIMHERR